MFDWDDFLALAEELAARPGNEAASRSAISRAYYAAFHAGRDYLARVGIPIQRSRFAYVQVLDELRKKDQGIADAVKQLQDWRKEADYDNPCSFDVIEQATAAVAIATERIEQIKALT